jgi:hypothetical protein
MDFNFLFFFFLLSVLNFSIYSYFFSKYRFNSLATEFCFCFFFLWILFINFIISFNYFISNLFIFYFSLFGIFV